jgi:hypothetical protein
MKYADRQADLFLRLSAKLVNWFGATCSTECVCKVLLHNRDFSPLWGRASEWL